MKSYVWISLLGLLLLGLMTTLAVQFYHLSKRKIDKKITFENMMALGLLYGIIDLFFSLLYFWLEVAGFHPLHFSIAAPQSFKEFYLDSLYFSTVTLFAVGYGDIFPVGIGRLIAMVEAMLGYILPMATVIIFVKPYMRRETKKENQLM